MVRAFFVAVIVALASPGLAQDSDPPGDQPGRPLLPFMERFAEELMDELLNEIQPEMERLMGEIVPQLEELARILGGIQYYLMPEILPNGDIIIRRRPDAPPLPQDFLEQNDPIDL